MGRTCILVVDDDPAIRQLLSITLTSQGYAVIEAASGEEALAVPASDRYDLVVLDNSMPGMKGCDVARALRDDPIRSGVPILMLSALVSDEEQWGGWRAGVDLYLTKPFDDRALVAHVQKLLRSSAAV